jgi:hypothetical protein
MICVTGTDWSIPLYELPFTGGIPGTYAAGKQYSVQSLIPGPAPPARPTTRCYSATTRTTRVTPTTR